MKLFADRKSNWLKDDSKYDDYIFSSQYKCLFCDYYYAFYEETCEFEETYYSKQSFSYYKGPEYGKYHYICGDKREENGFSNYISTCIGVFILTRLNHYHPNRFSYACSRDRLVENILKDLYTFLSDKSAFINTLTSDEYEMLQKWMAESKYDKKEAFISLFNYYNKQYYIFLENNKHKFVEKIEVKDLFGNYSYSINIGNRKLAFFYGPNAMGKTTVFKIVESIFSVPDNQEKWQQHFEHIFKTPFTEITVYFDDDETYVRLHRINPYSNRINYELNNIKKFSAHNKKDDLFKITKPETNKDEFIKDVKLFKSELALHIGQNLKNKMKFIYIPEIDKKKIKNEISDSINAEFKGMNTDERNAVKLPKIEMLKKSFEFFYNEDDPSRKIIEGTNNFKWHIENKNKDTIEIDSLSSGEKNLLYILVNIIFSTKRGAIIVIDEPELSLNINWQQQFAYVISNLTSGNGIEIPQIIGITHSPFIVSGDRDLIITADIKEK